MRKDSVKDVLWLNPFAIFHKVTRSSGKGSKLLTSQCGHRHIYPAWSNCIFRKHKVQRCKEYCDFKRFIQLIHGLLYSSVWADHDYFGWRQRRWKKCPSVLLLGLLAHWKEFSPKKWKLTLINCIILAKSMSNSLLVWSYSAILWKNNNNNCH